MILYFSGTGNSRFVAEMVASICEDDAVSMNTFIKEHKAGSFTSDKPYVFVSPVYVSAIPRTVEKFIEESVFSGSRDAYFIMTCAGGMGGCPAYAEKICEKKGFKCKGTCQIVMPQNYLVFFNTKDEETNGKIIDDAVPSIKKYAELIKSGSSFPDSGMKKWEYVSTEMILGMYYKWFMKDKKFYAGESCISCGKCVQVCPLDNIRLENGKPEWTGNCTHCMACINSCPKSAIEYGKASVGKPRYICKKHS